MQPDPNDSRFQDVLDWCSAVAGPCEPVSGDSRFHGRTSVVRLRTPSGWGYLKIHRRADSWEREVHGYERWASAFGKFAPRLIGVREAAPRALLLAALPGRVVEGVRLSPEGAHDVWRQAGRTLVGLHTLPTGSFFGPCRRDGSPAGSPVADAETYLATELDGLLHEGLGAGWLSPSEAAVVRLARKRISAFAGEPPTPCHRDYGPANWLVDEEERFSGVIDFEFSRWDVRVADFSRYPDWQWMHRPDLLDALFDGYGQRPSPRHEEQLRIARTRYALGAIRWGLDHAYHGFVEEGRQALRHLARLFR